MPDTAQIKDAARAVVQSIVGSPVKDTDPLISSGLIDSLSIVNLVVAMEERLKVKLPLSEVQPDDFDTIELIVETFARLSEPG